MPKPDDERHRASAPRSRRACAPSCPAKASSTTADELRAFETDGLTAYRQLPMLAVLPETVAQVSRVLNYCHENGIRVVPRGSGTSLSGGALPLADGVLLVMSKFNNMLDIDFDNRVAVVQPGVTNLGIDERRRAARLLLRAGSLLADRLLDRRQRGGEFRRRALPEIRTDRQQRARHRDGADHRRGGPARRQASRCRKATTCSA